MGLRMREMKSMKMIMVMMIYMVLAVWISPTVSFPQHAHPIRNTAPNSFVGRQTQMHAFSWFNKDGESNSDDKDSNMDSQLSENLSQASSVMESFKISQLIGERSGAALQELSYTLVEGISADGNVKVTFNGQQIPVGVKIDENYLAETSKKGKEGIDALCTALTYAMQDAHYKSGIQVEEKMKSVYTDLEFD